jgi:predicted transcriptional regulator
MGKIVIRTVEMPRQDEPDKMIKWFCAALGFPAEGIGISIEEQMLKKFIMASQENKGLPSSEFHFKPKIARSTVIYHLNRFIEAGLVIKKGRKYYLRGAEMQRTMEEIQYDMEREMRRMIDMAREFDTMVRERFEKGDW